MLCPKCGKAVPDRSRSCGSCGQTIDVDGDLTNSMRILPEHMNVDPEGLGGPDAGPGAGAPPPGLFARLKRLFSR